VLPVLHNVEAVALVELDSARDACNIVLPFGEPLCAAPIDADRASTADEHTAAAALDDPLVENMALVQAKSEH
jgi:hypothetical protein